MNMNVEAASFDGGKYLGYSELNPKQVEVMASFIQGFVTLLTGYGKSIIYYAALPLAFDKLIS